MNKKMNAVMTNKNRIFMIFKIKNLIGLPETLSKANGITTNVSKKVTPKSTFRNMGSLKPKNEVRDGEKTNPRRRNKVLVVKMSINEAEITLLLSCSDV